MEKLRLGAVTQVRNESKRVLEWINFHKKVGIERFIIFDDDSSDNLREIAKKIPGVSILRAINYGQKFSTDNQNSYAGSEELQVRIRDSLKTGCSILKKENFDWAACIDVDEFIVPTSSNTIQEYLKTLKAEIPKIYLASFDMKCPIDLDHSVIKQSLHRWSEDTRVHGRALGVDGLFKTRGKSMINLEKWSGGMNCVHIITDDHFQYSGTDLSKYPHISEDPYYKKYMTGFDTHLRLFHYRNNGLLQSYDEKDDRALVLFNS
jgi:hypothetical protein